MGLVQELQKAVQNSTTTAHESTRGQKCQRQAVLTRATLFSRVLTLRPSAGYMDLNARWLFDTFVVFLEPDELYTLAKTEYKAWVRFVVVVEEKLLVNEENWDTMRESWLSE